MGYESRMTWGDKRPNRLIDQKSPYLLLHAYDPVDWFPWGSEAFAKAQQEDRPIFLSIGYSACHWCHLMQRESFQDPEVARRLNEVFVCIKVDREERPDIDAVYMEVCQSITGRGGWPLTIIMTPDKHPFFAATYLPKRGGQGQLGMLELIDRIEELWRFKRQELVGSAKRISKLLGQMTATTPGQGLGEIFTQRAFEQLSRSFDERYGGFGRAPKFPTPHQLSFLLRYWKRTGEERALHMVEKTLQAMRQGGIYDQLGFGFHRYSTDDRWLVPHFEKMLYDQALLALSYIEAYQATGKEGYHKTAREIFSYVLRDMTAPEGGFYSAEGAESEGEEGKYYLWSEEEIREVLTEEEAEWVIGLYNVQRGGNFPGAAGRNILHLRDLAPRSTAEMGMTEEELERVLEIARQKLLLRRNTRIPPQKDDKILTDWNGLMIAALAKGAQALAEPRYAQAAARAAGFLLSNLLTTRGGLYHRYRAGEAAIPGFLDDYAFLIWGLLELYEATFEAPYLEVALQLNQYMLRSFWDDSSGGFYFTQVDHHDLPIRRKEVYDGALPSGNSVALLNLIRLARMTGDSRWEEKALQTGQALSSMVGSSTAAYTQLMVALDFLRGPSLKVVIVGRPGSPDTRALLTLLGRRFLPNKVVLLRPPGEEGNQIVQISPFTRDYDWLGGKATVYICQDGHCYPPMTKPAEVERLLEDLSRVNRK